MAFPIAPWGTTAVLNWIRCRAWPVLKNTYGGWSKDDGFLLSAAMAYYATFSLLPLVLVLIAGLGLIARFSTTVQIQQQQLIEIVGQRVSPWLADQLSAVLEGVRVQAGVGGPLGLLALLGAAIGIFYQFQTIFDRIWANPEPASRGWIAAIRAALVDRLVAFLMLLGIGLLLLAVFVANLVLSGVQRYVEVLPGGHTLWNLSQTGFTLLLYTLLFALIYRVIPRPRVHWIDALHGGFWVALVWQLGQRLLAQFVIGEKYSAYGVVGSFIAIMLWTYYASAVIFLGAEFVQALCAARKERSGQPAKPC